MNYSIRENEVLLGNILRKVGVKVVNVDELRNLYKDVKILEKLIVESGKNKRGNVMCRVDKEVDIERCIVNIVCKWRDIKLKDNKFELNV